MNDDTRALIGPYTMQGSMLCMQVMGIGGDYTLAELDMIFNPAPEKSAPIGRRTCSFCTTVTDSDRCPSCGAPEMR